MYQYVSDSRGGSISKKEILQYLTQEEIYEFAVGFTPMEGEYICSPFREDTNPGCFFNYNNDKGTLYLMDYSTSLVLRGEKLSYVDCFAAVKLIYKLRDFRQVLHFIYDNLCKGRRIKQAQNSKNTGKRVKGYIKIIPYKRNFDMRDKQYWQQYYISKQNLIDDKVLPLDSYLYFSSLKGNMYFQEKSIHYCYCEFSSGNKKIYFPKRPKNSKYPRFITNCDENDVGGLSSLPPLGDKLVITSSYKDWRVLTNSGFTAVWFQSEGMIPEMLFRLCKRFTKTIIFYDNDSAGLEAAKTLVETINQIFPGKAHFVVVPKIKDVTDPSDYIKYNILSYNKFINNHL